MKLYNKIKEGTLLKTISDGKSSYKCLSKYIGVKDGFIQIEIVKNSYSKYPEVGEIFNVFTNNFNTNNYKIVNTSIRKI